MIRWLVFMVASALTAGLLGWALTRAPEGVDNTPKTRPSWQIMHAGAALGSVLDQYDGVLRGPVRQPDPVATPRSTASPEARVPPKVQAAVPQPPDIAQQFRDVASAIIETEGGRGVWIVDGQQNRRLLRVGSAFKDGWRVASIRTDGVTLSRGNQRRNVDLFALPMSAPAPIATTQPESAAIAPDATSSQSKTISSPTPQTQQSGARNRIARPRPQGSTP
jgi:hypothetical protein